MNVGTCFLYLPRCGHTSLILRENNGPAPVSTQNLTSIVLFMRRFLTVTTLARLALLAVLAFSLHQLDEMRPPSRTAWARHLAEGKDPAVAEHVQVGLWYGAAARAGISGVLLALSLAWPLRRPAEGGQQFDLREAMVSPGVFWTSIGVIILVALAMRLPRMEQSFWGDEADAVACYVHGQYRPFKKKDPQGPLYFEQASLYQTFFSARHGPNNHVLFSLASRACLAGWQDWMGKGRTEFEEWPIRVPSLFAGLGSLAALACLLRRWGAAGLGLLSAAFMAMHPWHVRYSTEARGYALSLCLLPLALSALTNALEKRRWRHWLAFALAEFLLMYSWAGMAYPLIFVNLAGLVMMLRRADRWMLLVRWLTASLLAAAAFFSLYAPHLPQIKRYNATHLWMKGLPMDEVWLHNLLAAPFTGMPYHGPLAAGPTSMSWQRLLHESPLLMTAGFSLIFVAFLAGMTWLWRRNCTTAAVVTAPFLAAIVATLHFKFVIGDEMRVWYVLFILPSLAACVAAGVAWLAKLAPRLGTSTRGHAGVSAALLTVMIAALWPMNHALMASPAEDFKGVMAATREKHEIFYPKGRAEIFTCWLWRFSALYDPRGEIHVRDEPSLRRRMEEAGAREGGLFVILGFRALAQKENPGMLQVLEDPALFKKVAEFPSYDPIGTLEVYQMRKSP